MSKAITGAVEIGAAVGFFAAAAFIPGAAVLVGSLAVDLMVAGIGVMGVGMEAGAIADALSSNRGESITIRQPAAPRQYVYGTQRIGGNLIFASTTGSSKDQLNRLFVLCSHELWAIEAIYLDGRRVYFAGSGVGYGVRNGYGFGGGGDGRTYTGPDGSQYVFNNATSGHSGVYLEARYGDQATTDYMGSLSANDSRWGPDANGDVPCVGGCAYIYLKAEADPNTFPQEPEIRVTVKGKPVYDPRTGVTAYSENPALLIADYLTNPEFGLNDAVNQEQLIAAASICDELVTYAGGGGGTEARYTCHYKFDSSVAPGDVVTEMLKSMGGRMSYIGGEWYLWPATYIGPSLSFNESSLVDNPTWKPKRQYRTLCNRVQGSYTAPNYPYSAATAPGSLSDLYDTNGFYDGQIQNNFPFAFQASSYPTYAADQLHGYASDEWLSQDGGVELYQTLDLPAVLSVSQAQRLAKIELLRNRQQGTGTLVMGPEGYNLQPCDTFYMTFPQRGWANKLLEVTGTHLIVDKDDNGLPLVKVAVDVQETDQSVYEWGTAEELTPYDVAAAPPSYAWTTAPPTNVQLISGAASALVNADGTVTPRIEVTWDTPEDVRVSHIQTQYQISGASTWTDGGTVGVDSNLMYIGPIVSGQTYSVQIRSLQANGGASAWVSVLGFDTGTVLSVSNQSAIGPGSLVGEAYSNGTAAIECQTFTAPLGGKSVTYFPDVQTISGLGQQQLYYVYVVDPNLTGGDLTPVATQNQADYLGKLGYFFIDSVVTPYASASGGGTSGARYYPSSYQDVGSRTTTNPAAAYDGDLSSYAGISGNASSDTYSSGEIVYQGDPNISLPGSSTLTVVASVRMVGTGNTASITPTVNGTTLTPQSFTATTAQATYTWNIPANTPLSTISVDVQAMPIEVPPGQTVQLNTAMVLVYEIYVQS